MALPVVWDTPPVAGDAWYVLRTRSRQEKVVRKAVQATGMFAWLPLVERLRVYRRNRRRVELPLFPGYVFVRGSLEQAWQGASSERVASLIEVNEQDCLHRELCSLRVALEVDHALDLYPYLREGVRVRVTGGPLRGVEGIVEKKMGETRLVLRIQTLGQCTSLEIDPSLLEPVG